LAEAIEQSKVLKPFDRDSIVQIADISRVGLGATVRAG
jgi:hypothetical protein